ncbi:hypothetical protein BsWGS_05993 [Bradybaena similaris]
MSGHHSNTINKRRDTVGTFGTCRSVLIHRNVWILTNKKKMTFSSLILGQSMRHLAYLDKSEKCRPLYMLKMTRQLEVKNGRLNRLLTDYISKPENLLTQYS